MQVEAHSAEINCIGFAPSSDYLVLTGSSDKVGLQDGLC